MSDLIDGAHVVTGDSMDVLQELIDFFSGYGYFAVFGVLLLCGFGLPIPEDITLVAGGVISGLNYTDVHIMLGVSFLGVLLGDGTMFMLGKIFGERILEFKIIKKIVTPERYKKVQEKFEKYGNWVLFFARFMPGLRSPIFMTAGISGKISFWQFLMMDGLAAVLSVPIWVYLGYYGAHEREWLTDKITQGESVFYVIVGLIILLIIGFLWRNRKNKNV
jgi:LPXTG-motif cell wall-anchored protein